jgi:uncharacterized protein (TIGR04551 family)
LAVTTTSAARAQGDPRPSPEEKKAEKPGDTKEPPKDAPKDGDKNGDKGEEKKPDDAPLLPPGEPKPAPEKPGEPKEKAAAATAGAEKAKGEEKTRPKPGDQGTPPPSEIFAEDWWTLSRPTIDFHGYYRVRAEFFHQFDLGRVNKVLPLWPRPADDTYLPFEGGGAREVKLCGDSGNPSDFENCESRSQAGANMRFRFNPELHISDNLRIRAQIDMLDNIVLGSTPEGYANKPGRDGGYAVVARGGYSPIGAFASTQWAPVAGVNSTKDSILVKRVWGEYSSPIGQIRFGRMPSHWGMGMLVNSGDGYDSDWQSTADRIMFIAGHRGWDLYGAFGWDFANEGPNSASLQEQQGQPYDLSQKDDVDQFVFVVMRRRNEQVAKTELATGKPVVEGGAYFVYRHQKLSNDLSESTNDASLGRDSEAVSGGYVRRQANAFIPDLWFRFRWKKFRFETEAALIGGSIENTLRDSSNYVNSADQTNNGWKLLQFGLAVQSELRLLEDKLKLQLDFGYATGDSDVDSLAPLSNERLQPQLTLNRTYSTFRFHPDYRVDLILFRNILTRVQGAYYFKPTVGYEFLRDPDGQKIGGDASLIWSRASQRVQTFGHANDLGVELNFRLYYQAKDGVLNDDLEKMGGFFTSLEYGVLFPLGGLGYLPGQVSTYAAFQQPGDKPLDTSTAQTVRWYLGILY